MVECVKLKKKLIRCDECGKPVMEVRGDHIIIKAKHDRNWHTTIIELRTLIAE